MVPGITIGLPQSANFPRIRGDGPSGVVAYRETAAFSPYSRGWSRARCRKSLNASIFPVFAGMVPRVGRPCHQRWYFPRIRGDGPGLDKLEGSALKIFPVFAGMVPDAVWRAANKNDFPRIRGDGPKK